MSLLLVGALCATAQAASVVPAQALGVVHAPTVDAVALASPPSASTPAASVDTSGVVTGGIYSLVKDLRAGDVELRSFRTGASANFCHRSPVVVTRVSPGVAVNTRCPSSWTDLSCSCVQAVQGATVWELLVTKRTNSSDTTAPVPAAKTSSPITVSSIGAFLLPENVATLYVAPGVVRFVCYRRH